MSSSGSGNNNNNGSAINVKPRVNAAFRHTTTTNNSSNNGRNDDALWNDASTTQPPFEDDDDNDKHSKIQRTAHQFLWRRSMVVVLLLLLLGMMVFVLAAAAIGRNINTNSTSTQQQQTTTAAGAEAISSIRKDPSSSSSISFKERDTQLATIVKSLDRKVRARKATKGVWMEIDPEGMMLTKALQEATLALLQHRYLSSAESGGGPFRIRVDISYPDSILNLNNNNNNNRLKKDDYFVLETAPTSLLPCSVFYFLELARTYQSGSFHRNAPHVLQAHASSAATARHRSSMPFQEYSELFPHAQYTVGYAGRPSGPGWYVSIQDNTHNHGPGTQQKENPHEADSLFGKLVVDETDNDSKDYRKVMETIHSVPQTSWLDKENEIAITKLTILVFRNNGGDGDWVPLIFPVKNEDLMLVMQ